MNPLKLIGFKPIQLSKKWEALVVWILVLFFIGTILYTYAHWDCCEGPTMNHCTNLCAGSDRNIPSVMVNCAQTCSNAYISEGQEGLDKLIAQYS